MSQLSRIHVYLFSAAVTASCLTSHVVSAGNCGLNFGPVNSRGVGPRKPRPVTPALSKGCVAEALNIEVINGNKVLNFSVKRQAKGNGDYWTGADSEGSELSIFEDKDGGRSGSFVDMANNQITQFVESSDGIMIAETTNGDDFPPEGEPQDARRLLGAASDEIEELPVPSLRGIMKPAERDLQAKTVFDVLVVWTKKSECDRSGTCSNTDPYTQTTMTNMFNTINLAIQETNDAYTASGVNAELRLVHAYRHPTYVEAASNAFGTALSHIASTTDNVMDEVHTKRNEYGADIVAMIIDDPQYCGMAYLGPNAGSMFSVTAWNCATGYYSFGHEIGHNQGCNHDRGTSNACTSSTSNYGFRDPSARFRSILAYSCASGQCDGNPGGGCTRVKMFSNPNNLYNGNSIGNAANNNAQKINDGRVTVAAYRSTTTDCSAGMTCSDATGECICNDPVVSGCNVDEDCSDYVFCNGAERCNAGTCESGQPPSCSNNNACDGLEFCDAIQDMCVSGTPLACNDNNPCNGVETCDAVTGCVAGTAITCSGLSTCGAPMQCQPSDGSCAPASGGFHGLDGTCGNEATTADKCNACVSDCSAQFSSSDCGNGICEDGETWLSCSQDCASSTSGNPSRRFQCSGGPNGDCSNSGCTSNGFQCTSAAGVTGISCCGDNICEGDETFQTCPEDCNAPAPTTSPPTDSPVNAPVCSCDGLNSSQCSSASCCRWNKRSGSCIPR